MIFRGMKIEMGAARISFLSVKVFSSAEHFSAWFGGCCSLVAASGSPTLSHLSFIFLLYHLFCSSFLSLFEWEFFSYNIEDIFVRDFFFFHRRWFMSRMKDCFWKNCNSHLLYAKIDSNWKDLCFQCPSKEERLSREVCCLHLLSLLEGWCYAILVSVFLGCVVFLFAYKFKKFRLNLKKFNSPCLVISLFNGLMPFNIPKKFAW